MYTEREDAALGELDMEDLEHDAEWEDAEDEAFDEADEADEEIEFETSGGGLELEDAEDGWELESAWELDEPQLADYQVIGVDTRRRITRTTVAPWRHVCRLDPPGCTGTLVAPNKVLTAAHCVYSSSGKPYAGIRVTPGKSGAGTTRSAEPFGSRRAARVNFPAGFAAPYKRNDYNRAWPHDYAIITLDKPFPSAVGYWKQIRVESTARMPKLRLNTAGYPGDRGGQQQLFWAYDKVISVRDRRVEYLMDTAGGQSGSPVWLKYGSNRYIVAVHTARDDLSTPTVANRGVRITKTVLADIRRWMRP